MPDIVNRVSSQSVKKATDKTWDEWIELLDKEGARSMSHTEIARYLCEKGYIESPWWCQMVANSYEIAIGRRAIGSTIGAGYEIGAQMTVDAPVEKVWRFVISQDGIETWLGSPVLELHLKKGQTYETEDGTVGEIRSFKEGQRLRLTWKPPGWRKPSTLQLTVVSSSNRTSIRFHQENLPDEAVREQMRNHWKDVLARLVKAL